MGGRKEGWKESGHRVGDNDAMKVADVLTVARWRDQSRRLEGREEIREEGRGVGRKPAYR